MISSTRSKFANFSHSVFLVRGDDTITIEGRRTQRVSIEESNGNIYVSECIFIHCSSDLNGGAIYFYFSFVIANVSRTTFANCYSGDNGGAVNSNIKALNMVDICAYQCYCGRGKSGNCIYSPAQNSWERITFVECAPKLSRYGSNSAVMNSDNTSISDINISYENSEEYGSIYFENEMIKKATNILLQSILCKKMMYIKVFEMGSDLFRISFINCTVLGTLLSPVSNKTSLRESVFAGNKGNLIDKKSNMIISDSFFDVAYDYQYLVNCSVVQATPYPISQNGITKCAYHIRLYILTDTKTMDIIVISVVLLIFVVAIIASSIYHCVLNPSEKDEIVHNRDQQYVLRLSLGDESSDISGPNGISRI